MVVVVVVVVAIRGMELLLMIANKGVRGKYEECVGGKF